MKWNLNIDVRSDHLSDEQIDQLLVLIEPYSGAMSASTPDQGTPGFGVTFDVTSGLVEYAALKGVNLVRDWAKNIEVSGQFRVVGLEARLIEDA